MTVDTQNTPPGLQAYLNRIGEPEHPVLQALRGRTQNHRLGKMALARPADLAGTADSGGALFGSGRVYRL